MTETANVKHRQIRIWQQNCCKSDINQQHLINQLDPKLYDICLVQEPYIDFLKNTRAPGGWRVIYPPKHLTSEDRTRSVIFISPRLATSNWMDLRIDSPDITAVQIWGPFGTVRIFNIYNDCEHSRSIETLEKWHENASAASHPPTPLRVGQGPAHELWLGDFNHHPNWEEERNHHLFTDNALDLAEPL